MPLTALPVTYKYALVHQGGATSLEVGENRLVGLGGTGKDAGARPPSLLVTDDSPLRRGTLWRGAALAAPVFALRTRRSVGVGEFADLKPLVDVCSAAGAMPCDLAQSGGTKKLPRLTFLAGHVLAQSGACRPGALVGHASQRRR